MTTTTKGAATMTVTMTALVLFTRKFNENASTAMDPMAPWEGQVDLAEEGTFCVNPDFDALVSAPLYEVREVTLPAWLPAAEWVKSSIDWRYTWGAGVRKEWPEAWQRGLRRLSFRERFFAAKLLATKSFRSDFRRSLRDQIVTWLETPVEDRRFTSPLSPRQWECVSHRPWEAEHAQGAIYRARDCGGRTLTREEAAAALETPVSAAA